MSGDEKAVEGRTIRRIQRICKVISATSVVAMILAVALAAIMVVMAVVLTVSPDLFSKADWWEDPGLSPSLLASACAFGAISCSMLFPIAYLIHRISSDMKTSHTPFRPEYARDIRYISILLAAYAALSIATNIAFSLVWSADEIAVLGLGEHLPILVSAAIVYFMSLVFAHGTELQRTSDELL
ncbi:MAG: DUF2975 domain-containing protein [Candidatus Methanoplasma sp.]|jgi:hypothetical protein|nr:DUF2975 domain-containing protein [Candidatus Methanoplasma sp.]